MSEPTEEQVAAFKQAWEAEDVKRDFRALEPGDRTRAGLRAVFALSKDNETGQPAYDDHMTRQFLVQVLPNANVAELEQKRAWIAGEVSIAHRVRAALARIQGKSMNHPEVAVVLEDIADIVEYRADH